MRKYVVLNKSVGETPLVVQERWRKANGIDVGVSLAYAGRLDPMASGKLLILIGDECKKQDQYLGLDKEYEFEILFGFKSDSGDVLGLAESDTSDEVIVDEQLARVVRSSVGNIELPYPVFSSKPVNGKPLFMWKLEDRLDEIEVPTKKSEIYRIDVLASRDISAAKLQKQVFEKINSIPEVTEKSKQLGADFRRNEIREQWERLFEINTREHFQIVRLRCICSSGTYMRTLAEYIGAQLGMASLAFSIHRTKIGKYTCIGPVCFWRKCF